MSAPLRALEVPELTASEAFERALVIAAGQADDVDRRARFPSEAVKALRSAGALSWGVPREFGGAGARIDDLAEATFELSSRCAATGMVFAMHQIQVASIVRHSGSSLWFQDYLTPEQVRNNIENRIPLQREGTPSDVATAVAMLVENDFITGETVTVDGGMTMRIL